MKMIYRLFRASIVLTLILVALPSSNALAFSDGPFNPGSATNVSAIGTEPWMDPGNIIDPGFPYTSALLYNAHRFSYYLQATVYGFDIPTDATITGIELRINRMSSGNNPSIGDNVVSLVKAGAVVGENKASVDSWPTSMTIATYGTPTDLWGTTWTPEEVNNANFGAVLATARDNNGNNERYAIVDSLQITVYYFNTSSGEVVCGDGLPVYYGDPVTCTATITSVGSAYTPTGSITWTSDGSGVFDPATCTLSGSGDSASCSTLYQPTAVGSGIHLVTGDYGGDDYFVPTTASDTLLVDPRPVTVTADPQAKVYGDLDPDLTYQVTAGTLVFSDTFTGILTREPGEDVGTYLILQGTLDLDENYDLTYVGADFTIQPVAITVTASPATKVYGQVDPTLTYTITSGTLFAGDTFTGTLTREPGESAGTYAILQGSLALPGYYALTFEGADFTITRAEPTCVVTPYSVALDMLPHTATGSCTGVNGELLAGLDLSGTTHYKPGDYIDPWTFTDVTGNYHNAAGTVNNLITGYLYWWPMMFR